MKIVSFNINGIRARLHQLEALVGKYEPDVMGLQETKVRDEEFPLEAVTALGYRAEFYGQKGHYGVALLSRRPALEVVKGLPSDPEEAQRRVIFAAYPMTDGARLWVANAYWPQGEERHHPVKFPAKERFFQDLGGYLAERFSPADRLILMGDANVALTDGDIGIGEDNARRWLRSGKCSFLPEERQWLQGLLDWGLEDTFRVLHPEVSDRFSWFDYRSRGFERVPPRGLRIDVMLATSPMTAVLQGAGIDYELRGMERPSDHCPVWSEFGLEIAGD